MYIPKLNTIVEVKSNYTLGLTGKKRPNTKMWRQNQAKAKATLASGYKYKMMVMHEDGTRSMLPKGWYDMKALDVLLYVAIGNTPARPKGTKKTRLKMSDASRLTLKRELAEELQQSKKPKI